MEEKINCLKIIVGSMVTKNIFVQTYGCTSNKADSQTMMGLLKQAGYEITFNENDADYLLVNSCAVKNATEDKIIHRLKELSKLNKKLIVTGCLTKVNPDRIRKILPNFAGMLDPRSVHKIVDVIKTIDNGNENVVQLSDIPAEKPQLPRFSFSKSIDIIKISEGCLSNCSFCGTKLARGHLYSYRPDIIRDAVKAGLAEDYKEFHLTSEDSSAYGREIETNLTELLESITRIEGKFFIRVGMMNPLHFKKVEIKDLIEIYKNEKIFKLLHLCVQSGSNKILKIMRRGYAVEDFVYYIEQFKEEIPELTLMTDIIVGHPGETEDDFEQTLNLIKEVKPDAVHISKFGPRPGTPAAKMEKINTEIISERSKILHDLARKISLENNQKWLGWKGEIIIDEEEENFVEGRNFAYKPIIIKEKINLGSIIDVKVVDVKENFLVGNLQ
ncbi:MAG: tRNA (N(6)-L-threonylcarbamoyladenosine(37)-C(2))-methylthiotransferase [Candidatus Aenigmarchaeota archaeon]|nr:tRNA (N(6)-L-threonylcarbamoyladenosine(37)-C(2))-methylthiotransferase [Candidatus Aenigmarchaeota archaeon]